MIKSFMDFLDVLFPVNLGPLTYRCPIELSEQAEPGMIVSAPLKNKITKGIVKGRSIKALPGEPKEILAIHGDTPVVGGRMMHLLKWMAEYYLSEEGLVLKNMLPREAFTKVKQKKTKIYHDSIPPLVRGDKEGLKEDYLSSLGNIKSGPECQILDSVKKDEHETFLLHAPSSSYEYSFLLQILSEIRYAIVLAPEISLIDSLYPLLKEKFRGRVCLFHSGMSGGKRSDAIDRILSEKSDIVLGTRSAIFAPIKKVSFISVLHEHSGSYKQEEGLRYHGRDVAVMRACLERATILLSSICPSFESLYNCRKGKYRLLEPGGGGRKPRIRVVDMRYEKLLKPYLSRKIIDAAAKFMKRNGKVMFLINRRGYSTLLRCAECNYIEECPACKIPLVFHKQDLLIKCHYCGYSTKAPQKCSRCKGHSIELLGAGTQRAQEDIEKLLGTKTLRFDSDTSRKRSEVARLVGAAHSEETRIVVGTKMMTGRLGINGSFSMAAVLNTDLSLQMPDFRSMEKTYQEIMSVGDRIMTSGEIYIQTRMPQHYLFKCIRNYDYRTFFREELERRKSLHYPPCTRLLLMRFISKRDLTGELSGFQRKSNKEVEILGPSLPENKKGKYEFKLLLKSSVRGALQSAAKTFLDVYAGSGEVTIKVDVDPVLI